ncbi:MAG: magnesium transporter MgtE N-terminal domain-containing protein [Acidimicrobiales bacterium]
MAAELIYAFRVMRLTLLDADGAPIGRLDDVVLAPGQAAKPPRVVGFVATSQRRRIFVNANRVAALDNDGAHLRSWDLDLNPFKPRAGEILVSSLIDRRVGEEAVSDIALRPVAGRTLSWEVARVRLARRHPLRRRRSERVVDWEEVAELFATSTLAAEAARLRELHPSDVAAALRSLPLTQRRQLAAMLDDEGLADLLEELPEAEQLRLIEGLDLERVVAVFDEMEYDDLTDLLAEMPGEQRSRIIAAMEPEEADVVTRLLAYAEGSAGSLMTPEVIILGPTATVAEALAQVRDPSWQVSVAAQVYVTQAPFVAPTGTYLGVVHFQRLLREPPAMELGRCLEPEPTIPPTMPEREVAERLAAYNLLSVGVCDEAGHLLGAITVDDVLDRVLPTGWRQRRRTGVG